jgi:hypothetical protein
MGTIALHAGSPQGSVLQAWPVPLRSGGQVSRPQPPVQKAASAAASENSPLYTFTFRLIDYPRSNLSGIWGINDHGKMVGGYNHMNLEIYSADHGYELKGNTFLTIDYPGALQTELFAISKSGEIVGAFGNSPTDRCHGFKLVSGTYTSWIARDPILPSPWASTIWGTSWECVRIRRPVMPLVTC